MHRLFSKIKRKQDDGDVFWWILGHVSLLKLEKYVEDDNRQSVLQIDIVSSRKYCDYMSIASGEYSPTDKLNMDIEENYENDQIKIIEHSSYVYHEKLNNSIKNKTNCFSVLCTNAKFDRLNI